MSWMKWSEFQWEYKDCGWPSALLYGSVRLRAFRVCWCHSIELAELAADWQGMAQKNQSWSEHSWVHWSLLGRIAWCFPVWVSALRFSLGFSFCTVLHPAGGWLLLTLVLVCSGLLTHSWILLCFSFRSSSTLETVPTQVYSLIGSSPLRSTSSSSNVLVPVQEQHQPIVIPDTPSPPVSVITIRSDTDEEEDSKYKPAR